MPTDLTKLYRHPSGGPPVYRMLTRETIGPPDDRLTVTKWGKTDAGQASTRRYQAHDAAGVELYDTDDCHDNGNALHKLMTWLSEYEVNYLAAKHAATAAGESNAAVPTPSGG